MKKLRYIFVLLVASSFITACGGGGGSDDPDPVQPTPPGGFALTSPANNAICVNGVFSWSSSLYASSYELHVKNGSGQYLSGYPKTGISGTSYTDNNLPTSTAIAWYVVAKNSDGFKESNTYSASTPGDSQVNYLPVAASVVFSYENDNVTIVATDAEKEDISYVLETAPSSNFSTNIQELSSGNVSSGSTIVQANLGLISGQTYWLRISLIDTHGNQSRTVQSYTPN
ncbi:MAG: hypothetical protein OIF50_06605 [Flavobacteriaceae bacterium]|nr:hypothetical protein [Flavobacteriaceae bacterium]